MERYSSQSWPKSETQRLKLFIRNLGIDLVGIADLERLAGIPVGIPLDLTNLLEKYRYAVVLGAQLGKVRNKASGVEVSLFLQKAALAVNYYLEEKGYRTLTIHPEDEFDLIKRVGLMSLKVLAKGAGLGWQGRSLLIVSPDYGPIHRLIAVLTDMPLQADTPISNQCGDCSLCVDRCPQDALTLISFEDHPLHRAEVLNIEACHGDDSCKVCLVVCPWARSHL